MRRALALIAVASLAACEKKPSAQPERSEPVVTTNSDVELSWTLARDGERLALTYALVNKTAQPIFVADRLIARHGGKRKLVPERVIVMTGDGGDVVRFARGMVESDAEEFNHPPAAVELAAGASHSGSAVVPLPLKGWHNYTTPPPIPNNPARAELEIAYLAPAGDPVELQSIKLDDGARVKVPAIGIYLKLARTIRTAPRQLP